jgi:hypothetical protein
VRNFEQQRSDGYDQMFLQGHQTAVNDILQQYEVPINAAAAWRSGGQIGPYQPNLGLINTPQAGRLVASTSGVIVRFTTVSGIML